MTEKLVHCPACNSENLDNSVYCCQCASPMRKGIPAKIRRVHWTFVLVVALVLSVIFTGAIQLIFFRPSHSPVVEQQFDTSRSTLSSRPEAAAPAKNPTPAENTAVETVQLTIGMVSIVSPDLGTVAEFPAAVINGSWLALPSRASIGGNKWFFRTTGDEAVPVEGGIWGRGDAVGLWRLGQGRKFSGPGFATWQQDAPVRHLSLETGSLSEPMTLAPAGVQGAFIYSPLPEGLPAGVFLQNNRVVGWSFGVLLDGAYMWTLGPDDNLLIENYVDDFYSETFAGGREEYFAIALSKRFASAPRRQLQVLIEGFRVSPKLPPEDTPRYLQPETIYPYVVKLVQYLMDAEEIRSIAALTDEPLLWEIRDPVLMMNVTRAVQKSYDNKTAVDFLEVTGATIIQAMERGKDEVDRLHLDLYLGWIRNLIDRPDIPGGWQVYDRARLRFGESAELHLLGVELALAERDWLKAETLLYQREYPQSLRETRMLLTDRISDLKGQENKIVIRFPAGSRDIPTKATVNDRLEHDFLVDTGASFVTVPFATVKALGLEGQMSSHQLEVQTAGGLVKASAVTLSSVELQGWVVPNVTALVIDLPKRPGMGLLGLNFLDSFRVDLQSNEGVLILAPK